MGGKYNVYILRSQDFKYFEFHGVSQRELCLLLVYHTNKCEHNGGNFVLQNIYLLICFKEWREQ